MKSDLRTQIIPCESCGKNHSIEVDFSKLTNRQLQGLDSFINFTCPDIALMYRVFNFNFDLRLNTFKNPALKQEQELLSSNFRNEWGSKNFEAKLQRYINLDLSFIGIPEEYYNLLWPVVSSYCCGLYYPAMTSCGALGERILNRLILKTRSYFRTSEHFKKIYNKNSFDQWDYVIMILKDWKILSTDVAELFLKLKVYRNDSIHYNDGYDFEKNSHEALKLLALIIDKLFNCVNRKDLFWVFDIPGEIWLKSEVLNDPFVKEFVLPLCSPLTPFCEPTANPPNKGKNTPLKPISDIEFIEIRKNRTK